MKKLILMLLLIPSLVQAKTAVIEYTFINFPTHQVVIWVSETPGIDATTQIYGQFDTDEDGIVEITNIVPGKTYYFRARGYDKVTGLATGWSNELSQVVPAEVLPTVLPLPDIPGFIIPGFVLDSITYTAQ